jgi:hypothetical protein
MDAARHLLLIYATELPDRYSDTENKQEQEQEQEQEQGPLCVTLCSTDGCELQVTA